MPGFDTGSVMYALNVDFTGNSLTSGTAQVTTNGQLLIGSTSLPNIRIGTITSPLGTLNIGYSAPNITMDLVGGTTAVEKFNMQTGTTPVGPSGGVVVFNGATVAAGTHPVRTDGTTASTMQLEVQISQAIATTNITNIGLSAFDSAQFTVDANGFVSTLSTAIANTITGDSGGALSPSAHNWNILGRSGSKTSGSGATLTVKSPSYTDQGSSTTVTLNSGSSVTAAITLTLPASAGLADGDLFEFYCTTSGALVIQAVTAQQIRVGSLITAAAGTVTSTNIGDSISLRFRAADGFFYATSVVGTWIVT